MQQSLITDYFQAETIYDRIEDEFEKYLYKLIVLQLPVECDEPENTIIGYDLITRLILKTPDSIAIKIRGKYWDSCGAWDGKLDECFDFGPKCDTRYSQMIIKRASEGTNEELRTFSDLFYYMQQQGVLVLYNRWGS